MVLYMIPGFSTSVKEIQEVQLQEGLLTHENEYIHVTNLFVSLMCVCFLLSRHNIAEGVLLVVIYLITY